MTSAALLLEAEQLTFGDQAQRLRPAQPVLAGLLRSHRAVTFLREERPALQPDARAHKPDEAWWKPDENLQVVDDNLMKTWTYKLFNFKNPVRQARRLGLSVLVLPVETLNKSLCPQMVKPSTFSRDSLFLSNTLFRRQWPWLMGVNLNWKPAVPSRHLRVSPSLRLSPTRPWRLTSEIFISTNIWCTSNECVISHVINM